MHIPGGLVPFDLGGFGILFISSQHPHTWGSGVLLIPIQHPNCQGSGAHLRGDLGSCTTPISMHTLGGLVPINLGVWGPAHLLLVPTHLRAWGPHNTHPAPTYPGVSYTSPIQHPRTWGSGVPHLPHHHAHTRGCGPHLPRDLGSCSAPSNTHTPRGLVPIYPGV